MRLFIVLTFLFTSTTAFSQPKKGLFEGIGAFLGVLGAKQLDINNPYALAAGGLLGLYVGCLLYTSPSPRDIGESRMPSSA